MTASLTRSGIAPVGTERRYFNRPGEVTDTPVSRRVPQPRSSVSFAGSPAFRFSDDNPLTSGTYAQSVFRDLPDHVAYVVTELRNVAPGDWDALVETGEVYSVVSHTTTYRVEAPEVFEITDSAGRSSCTLTGQAASNDWMCT